MATTGKATYLYDKDNNVLFPYSDSHYIAGYVDNVYIDLQSLFNRVSNVEALTTGAKAVEGMLGVTITYAKNNSYTTWPEDMTSTTFSMPDENLQYAWKLTVYTWTSNNITSEIKTTHEIVATALYPETQFLYCVVSSETAAVSAPTSYPTTDDGYVTDTNGNKWYKTPQSVSVSTPVAYMTTRFRKAGETWDDKTFSTPACYGKYAFSSVPITMYKVVNQADLSTTAYEDLLDTTVRAETNPTGYSETIDYASLEIGTYLVIKILAIKVNGILQSSYDGFYWSQPTVVSTLTKVALMEGDL